MEKGYKLEICANSVSSAQAAEEGGASRVEFCQNLEAGGVTPSAGQIRLARYSLSIGLHVLIRPRAGDFLYSEIEFDEMKADIEYCKAQGCDGVVIGLLQADGRIDAKRTAALVATAGPMHVTFHRAFDVCRDPVEALETIIDCGCRRLLTSGMQNTALAGAALIQDLVRQARGRLEIMPGAGIHEGNLVDVVSMTGALAFHTSAKVTQPSEMRYTNSAVQGMGDETWVSSKQKIRRLADILKSL